MDCFSIFRVSLEYFSKLQSIKSKNLKDLYRCYNLIINNTNKIHIDMQKINEINLIF